MNTRPQHKTLYRYEMKEWLLEADSCSPR